MTLGFVYFVFLPSIATTLLAGRMVQRFGTRPALWGGLGVAAAGHLVLRSFMSATVAPSMPVMLFAGVAALAGLVAAQPEAFIRAWRSSRIARRFE